MKRYFLFFAMMLLLATSMIAQEPIPERAADGLTLVWNDEFDYTGAPDSTRWQFERGFVRNEELQWYQPQNAQVLDGLLQITGRREKVLNPYYKPDSKDWRRNRQTASYTSACIESRDRFTFRYGRLEVRARIPIGQGSWPAIWTLGNRWGWPACGEVDLMEYYRVPAKNTQIHHTTASNERTVPILLANACWQGPNGRDAWDTERKYFSDFTNRDPQWAEKFHVWRMDWTPDYIHLYLDDELFNDIPTAQAAQGGGRNHDVNPFSNDVPGFGQYILLNLAIGGCGGTPDDTVFPMVYEVDYVRVYQKK